MVDRDFGSAGPYLLKNALRKMANYTRRIFAEDLKSSVERVKNINPKTEFWLGFGLANTAPLPAILYGVYAKLVNQPLPKLIDENSTLFNNLLYIGMIQMLLGCVIFLHGRYRIKEW